MSATAEFVADQADAIKAIQTALGVQARGSAAYTRLSVASNHLENAVSALRDAVKDLTYAEFVASRKGSSLL